MTRGSLYDKLILFALPLAASGILQQLFNSVDVAIAGRYAGSDALAAVGANASLIALFVNIFTGLSIGTNVVIATYIGQNKKEEVSSVVHTSISLAFVMGLTISVILIPMARSLLLLIGTPEGDILDQAVVYLQIYLLGMPFILLFNFGSAILRSKGDTRRPMLVLIIAGVINALLNVLLVVVFHLGVMGVAISTVVSNIISTSFVIYFLSREEESMRFQFSKLRIEKKHLKRIILVGLPAGIQSGLFSLSNVFVQSGINTFGESGMAGSSTGLTFEYFSYYVSNSFSQAAVTFASQNYGAGKIDRCRRVTLVAFFEAILFTELLSGLMVLFSNPLVHLLTTDEAVIQYAKWRMFRVMALEGMTAIYEVPGGVMRGMGHSLLPAILTIFGTVVFRIIWILTVFQKYNNFKMLMWVYPASWVFNSIMMLTAYYFLIIRNKRIKE